MNRQTSLALALCLTVIVGFVVVAYGRQAGLFGNSEAKAESQDDSAAALIAIATYAAVSAMQPTATPTQASLPEPIVIDQYVYEDVVVGADSPAGAAPVVAGTTNVDAGGGTAPPQEVPAQAPVSLQDDDEGETWHYEDDDEDETSDHDEHEREHHDELDD